jgi:hypothetical protein
VKRYYFHVVAGPSVFEDHAGQVLPDLPSAIRTALNIVRETVSAEGAEQLCPKRWHGWKIDVWDERQSVLLLKFEQVIGPDGKVLTT